MMLRIVYSILLSFCFSFSILADESVHNYKVIFKNGNEYNIKTAANYISWAGTKGEEKGKADIIKNFQHLSLRKGIDVYQWVSERGSFNVFIIDHEKSKVIAAGNHRSEQWVWDGRIEPWA